jgi:hypothetical protein
MVNDVLPSLAAGRRVVSTVKLLDENGDPHPLWVPLSDFRTLLDVEKCDVLLDEVTGVASSRSGSSVIPPGVLNVLMQLRRRDVTLSFTAPAWNRAEKVIRECCQSVTLCQGFLPKMNRPTPSHHLGRHLWADVAWTPDVVTAMTDAALEGLDVPLEDLDRSMVCHIDRPHVHDDARQWGSKRLFYWRTFDAFVFDEWSTAKRERIRPVARQLYYRGASSAAGAAYDTLDQVLSVAAVTDAGRCVDCNGTRTPHKCKCAAPQPLELSRLETVPA